MSRLRKAVPLLAFPWASMSMLGTVYFMFRGHA